MNESIFFNFLFLGLIVMGQPSSTLEFASTASGSNRGLIAMEISTTETASEICIDDKGNKYHCPSVNAANRFL
ncbi:hypothetical protein NG794_21815 [Laspinema sp. D6]|nr:hypothetical protein [Laspinema sp. D3a]